MSPEWKARLTCNREHFFLAKHWYKNAHLADLAVPPFSAYTIYPQDSDFSSQSKRGLAEAHSLSNMGF